MVRLSQARSAVVLLTSVSLFCGAAMGAAGGPPPASGDPLSVVPADSLFCVEINNLMGTTTKIDQFLTGVSPIGVSMLVPMQLAQFLGGTEAKGINMSGSFALFGPLPGGEKPDIKRIALLVPVTDYKQFTEGNPNVTPPDAQGISAVGSKEQPMFVAANVPGYALVTTSSNRQALIETKKLIAGPGATALAKRLSPDELKRAQDSPVWAYANIQTLSKMYGPMIQAKLQEAKKMMEQMQTQGQAGAAMDMNIGLLNSLMQELQSASLTLDPTADAIRAGFVATPMPNTETAKILQGAAGTPDKKFLQYLENGAVMNVVMSIAPATWNRLNDLYFDMIAKVTGKTSTSEDIVKLKKWATEATNSLTGAVAGSFSADAKSKPPVRLQYVAGLKDAQAFYRALEQAPAMCQSGLFADLMKASGVAIKFDLKRNAETYKDVPIDMIRVGITPTDPNSPQGQIFAVLFGPAVEARLAVVNNLLVYAIAGDPVAGIHKLIDQVKSGAAQPIPSEVEAAMQLIPGSEKANFFATYNYLRVLQMVTAIMPMPIPQTPVQSKSDIAIAGKMAGGSLGIDLALPKQHLMEIVGVFMQMQQQKMQEQRQQNQPPAQPQGPPQKQPPPQPRSQT
jgi:hypothetical protein